MRLVAVDNPNVIDACGIDKDTEEAVLNIADHLPWTAETHLAVLQAKINRYLDFIESGQLLVDYPEAKGRPVRIVVWLKYLPDQAGIDFYAQAEITLRRVGTRLSFHIRREHSIDVST